MSAFKATREIPAPPGEVFGFLADGRRRAEWTAHDREDPRPPRWMREEVETEHVCGPEVGEGAVYRLRQRMGRKRMSDYTFRTEVYEPARRLVFRADAVYDVLFDLEETPAGTRLTYTRDYGEGPRGLVGKISRWALNKPEIVEASIADDLLRIERALGAGAPSPSAGTA